MVSAESRPPADFDREIQAFSTALISVSQNAPRGLETILPALAHFGDHLTPAVSACAVLAVGHRNKQCPATTCAVAPPADSRAHLFGASSCASLCRLPHALPEARLP